jgi:hypothetical protein
MSSMENSNLMARGQQLGDQRRADKSVPANQKNAHDGR